MKDERVYRIFPSDLSVAQAFRKLGDHLAKSQLVEAPTVCSHIIYRLHIESERTLACRNFPEFLETLACYPSALPVITHSHWEAGKDRDLMWSIDVWPGKLDVAVESQCGDINLVSAVHSAIQDIFQAKNPLAVPEVRTRYNVKKTVFLGHRFDDQGRETARVLRHFLERLGFDVFEGEGYAAKDIPDKVAERINRQDIFVCLFTPGDSSWLLTEAAFAKGRGKYIVILCEEKTEVNRGIIGSDYEYMTFPRGIVEKTFTNLLYALP
jgi:hypothetical protein